MITDKIPPPPRRVQTKRITDALRAMLPGQSELFPDRIAAAAFCAWARTKKWLTATRTEPKGVRVWRLKGARP